MEKEKISSFENILVFIKDNKSVFYDLIENCRIIHSKVFDYDTALSFDADDKEKAKKLKAEIESGSDKIIEQIKTSFDCDNLELTRKSIFNEIIMPLSEVVDK